MTEYQSQLESTGGVAGYSLANGEAEHLIMEQDRIAFCALRTRLLLGSCELL